MAQVSGFQFDQVWEERTNACLALLREAADVFSARGSVALDADRVVATFLWTLAVPVPTAGARWSRPRWPLRFFDGSEAPPPPIDSCQMLAPRRPSEQYH